MVRKDRGKSHNYPKERKKRSDKGKKHSYPRKRKPRSGGPLALGSLMGNEKGLKAGKLFTEKDRTALRPGDLWGTDGKRRKKK